ncbi:4Fe-4S dicluster domain-containing protein [Candidatus Altiarchaeota archaeon]
MAKKKETQVKDRPMEFISVHIMGKEHKVPKGLTILKSMEYAGYKFVRGAGCRAGFCGACATVYRKKGDYKLYTALACQATAEDGMFLTELPFVPANRSLYDVRDISLEGNQLIALYPEVARCVSCNTCTKACPQELEVMDFIQAALREDYEAVARLSFDCIQCGLCTVRCPAEIQHYHVAQLARRLYGAKIAEPSPNLKTRIKELYDGKYKKETEALKKMSLKQLKEEYSSRKIEKSDD